MLGLFKSKEEKLYDAALKRLLIYHEACMLYINQWEYKDEGKADLATHLYFLGAVDGSSQLHQLSDKQFGALVMDFFRAINTNESYSLLLLRFFIKMKSVPSAMKCVMEGGQHFIKWWNGSPAVPMVSFVTLEEVCNDPDFPISAGSLYVMVEKK
jgi:hypothetical protein